MKVILVMGPIVIDFIGKITIIGASYKDQRLRWELHKILPIEVADVTKIRFIGKTTSIFPTHNLRYSKLRLGTTMWNPIYKRIMQQNGKIILVLGPSDSGKSAFSLFLINKFTKLGLHTLLIDGDIGQGDLAPPSCIGSSLINRQTIDFSLVESERICFVGDIQPSKYFTRIIISINKLLEKSKHFDKCIINTDGFITGKGLYYKFKLAQTLHPDLIVYLGNDMIYKNLKVMINAKGKYSPAWLICKAPSALIKRSKYERYLKRVDTYLRFFKKYEIYKLKLDAMDFKILQMNKDSNNRYNPDRLQKKQLNFFNCQKHIQFEYVVDDLLNNQFVGLGKSRCDGIIHGFGIIETSKYGKPCVYATSRNFDCIYLSNVILKGMKECLLIK